MTILATRWPRLAALPYAEIATLPTPLVHAEALSSRVGAEILIKRDDHTSSRYGGNKVRKLAFLLGEARAQHKDTLVTTGAIGSHHVLATALYGRDAGFAVHALMLPQPSTPHVIEHARADLGAGASLHAVPFYAGLPAAAAALVAKLRITGKKPFVIGPGGSDPTGTLGYVEAGLELADQFLALHGKEPHAIYVPLGSGGTAAGLALGLAAAGVMAKVVAVRVTPRGLIRRSTLGALMERTIEKLREVTSRFPPVAQIALSNLEIDESQLGGGYGLATPAGREAIRIAEETEHLELDVTYTSKCLAALLEAARGPRKGQRLCYVHTLSSAPMAPLLTGVPPLPRNLEKLAKAS